MTNYLEDTPAFGRSYCPGCEPDADPLVEILETRWCDRHMDSRVGRDDDAVRSQEYLSGSAEAGGEDNRRWCDFIHRGIVKATVIALSLVLLASVAYAGPTLSWDTVTTDTTGTALPVGQEVKTYTVYRCPVNVNPCVRAQATVIGTVTATVPVVPRQSMDLAGQPFPAVFMVTASNVIAESADSLSIKGTPGDRPKNLLLQ